MINTLETTEKVEDFSKEIQSLKKGVKDIKENQMEISELKNSNKKLSVWAQEQKGVNTLEDKITETTQLKNEKKNVQGLRALGLWKSPRSTMWLSKDRGYKINTQKSTVFLAMNTWTLKLKLQYHSQSFF